MKNIEYYLIETKSRKSPPLYEREEDSDAQMIFGRNGR